MHEIKENSKMLVGSFVEVQPYWQQPHVVYHHGVLHIHYYNSYFFKLTNLTRWVFLLEDMYFLL
jgi:hypothetical protein